MYVPILTVSCHRRMQRRSRLAASSAWQPLTCLQRFFQQPSVKRMFESIRPAAAEKLPSAKVATGSRLTRMAGDCRTRFVQEMEENMERGRCLGTKADAWKSNANQHLYGVIPCCGTSRFTYEHAVGNAAGNVDRSVSYHGIAVAKVLEEAAARVEELCSKPVQAICTDEAGQYRRAKDVLALRHPHRYFGKCYAHWVNGVVKKLFFTAMLKQVVTRLAAVIECFRNSDPWANRLYAKEIEFYGKATALHKATKERWTTVQTSLASALKVQDALQSVATDNHHLPDVPACITDIYVNGPEVWRQFEAAEKVARPLAQAALWMQRNDANLADVLFMMARVRELLEDTSEQFSDEVEARWLLEEQPLLLLAGRVLAEMVDEEDDGEAAEEERQRGLLNPSTQEVAEEAVAMRHCKGEDERDLHPFPPGDQDNKSHPKQPRRLRGARGWKIRLADFFRKASDLPDVPDFPPLLLPYVE
eukprot:GHVU01199010.1.p1 GENE.GHVU01199010.1~~GHVU01199010.1.p1  ORF type:complete len:475 (+),score=81.50 GHVU01199010.1:727-2151(+)